MTFRIPGAVFSPHRHGAAHHRTDGHGHSRSHHSSTNSRSGIGFALAACLLTGWSLVPLASVGFFETRLLAMGAWILVGIACLFVRQRMSPSRSVAWPLVGTALLLWCTLQLIPLSAARFHFWRGDASVFAQIAAHAGGRLCMALVPYHSFHTLLYWTGLFALGCMTARCLRNRASLRVLLAGFILLAVAECAYGLFLRDAAGSRIRGTFANPDAFGGLLAMALPLTLGFFLDRLSSANTARRRLAKPKLVWGLSCSVVFLFQLVILFFTGSRGATASAFTALAIFLVWCWREFRTRRKALLGTLLLLALLAPLFFIHAQRQNVWERAFDDEFELQSDVEGRKDIWKAAFDLVRAFPCGTGPGGTPFAMPIYQRAVHGRYRLDYAHNDTLQFLGDLGWPGGALLLLALLLLARRTVSVCRKSDAASTTPWLQRGAGLALLAALIHSQAEFNLSARPPLQLMFVLLAGALFSSASDPGTPHHTHAHQGFRTWLFRIPVCLAAVVAVFLSSRAAIAYREARAAARTLDLPPAATDSPLLLPAARTLPIPPDDKRLARAARLGARSPFVQGILASIPLSNHRHAVFQTALMQAKALAARENEEADEEEPVEPEVTPLIVASVRAALRLEEADAVCLARPFADAALRLAPWDAQAMTDRAWLVLRGVTLRAAPASDAAGAHADLDLAAALYPLDAYTLSSICAALTAEEKPAENLPRILALAQRAFELNPSRAMASMDRWWRAGIPLSDLARTPDIPVRALQKLYHRALDASDTSDLADADAGYILSRIEERTAADVLPSAAAARWSPKQLREWERNRDRQRIWTVKEHLRRNLRTGDWDAVAASAPARAEARTMRFKNNLIPLEASPVLRRLRLREWNARHVLPRSGRVEWALAECASGAPPDQFRDVWEEAIRHAPLPPDQVDRLPATVPAAFPALLQPPPPGESAEAPTTLELPYLGERLFLEDISAVPDPTAPGGARLRLDWRFEAPPFPPGLRLVVRLRDEAGRRLSNVSIPFETAMPAFRRGTPPPGTRYRAEIPLPVLASYARTYEILLFDRKKVIHQDDLLTSLRLPADAIPSRPAPVPAP